MTAYIRTTNGRSKTVTGVYSYLETETSVVLYKGNGDKLIVATGPDKTVDVWNID